MLMEEIIRYMPPILGVVLAWVLKTELVPTPKNPVTRWQMWKPVGLLLPALWLTGIGPEGLVLRGGFLMRLIGISPSRQWVAIFGLIWLAVFFLSAWWLSSGNAKSAFSQRFACALSYAGLMGALGVYAFLAVVPDAHS
jgi:hypothetical protein